MAIARSSAIFSLHPAKAVYKQKVKAIPNEHHYENKRETPYIKYTCPICEQLAKKANSIYAGNEDEKFVIFQLQKGTEQCPCCGVNIDWDYKFE